MLDAPPAAGVPAPAAGVDLGAAAAYPAPAYSPEQAPPPEAAPAPDGAVVDPLGDIPLTPPQPQAAPASQAPAPPPPPLQQVQAGLAQEAYRLQNALVQYQQAEATHAERETWLKGLYGTISDEQFAPLWQDHLHKTQQRERQAAQIERDALQLQAANDRFQVAQQTADLEQMAAALAPELLIRQAQARTPALRDPAQAKAMAEHVARYDARHAYQAALDYERFVRSTSLQQRAAAGTDSMGGTSAAPAGPRQREDGATLIQRALARGR